MMTTDCSENLAAHFWSSPFPLSPMNDMGHDRGHSSRKNLLTLVKLQMVRLPDELRNADVFDSFKGP